MAKNIKKIAELLGAEIKGQVPHCGGGVFGAARLANIVDEIQRQDTSINGANEATNSERHEITIDAFTAKMLEKMAEQASSPDRKIGAMDIASKLLEQLMLEYSQQ